MKQPQTADRVYISWQEAPLGSAWHSHVSLSLDDGVNILRVDHAQHPIAEHIRCRVLHHDDEQAEKTAIGNIYSQLHEPKYPEM